MAYGRSSIAGLAVVALACAPRAEPGVEADRVRDTGLVATLDVGVESDAVEFGLHVSNAGAEAVVLQFASAQRYDFVVRTPAGELVWRWSDDQAFAQVLGTERLEPGATVTYRARWAAAGMAGRYIAEGLLVASDQPLALRMEFEAPAL